MRGEGTSALVRRSIAEFRACLSCTVLFQHGDAEKNQRRGEARNYRTFSQRIQRCHGADSCRAVLGWADEFVRLYANRDGAEPRHHRNRILLPSHYAGRLLLQFLRLIMRGQRVDNRLQLAVHHLL
jgi:hypothetical protein